jgi:hypothetical protein
MIKRFCFSERERLGDKGSVYITLETEDNQRDTNEFCEKLSELVAALPITGVNIQIMETYENVKYKTPISK